MPVLETRRVNPHTEHKLALKIRSLFVFLSTFKARQAVAVFPVNQDFARLTCHVSSTTQPLNVASWLSTVAAWETETTLRRDRNVPACVATQNAREVSGKATRFIVLILNKPYSVNRQINTCKLAIAIFFKLADLYPN